MKFGVHERPTLGVAVALAASTSGGRARVADARVAVGCVDPAPGPRAPPPKRALTGATVAELDDVLAEVAAALAAASGRSRPTTFTARRDYKREMVARRSCGARSGVAAARAAAPSLRSASRTRWSRDGRRGGVARRSASS